MRDTSEFDAFYGASVRRVVHYLYAMTGDLAEAQDLAQEAFARAWQHWAALSQLDSPEAWVRVVGWRLSVNRWRGLRRRLTAFTRHGPPPVVPGPSPEHVDIVTALGRLTPRQREVIVLFHLYDHTVSEIADATGLPDGTVKSHLRRGRAVLAGLLPGYDVPDQDLDPADAGGTTSPRPAGPATTTGAPKEDNDAVAH